MSETPQILLAHHLKKLKLQTFRREHEKVARQCATEGVDHVRFVLRLAELELSARKPKPWISPWINYPWERRDGY